jgi:hypothetical protein
MDAEGLLDQQAFGVMAAALELDLEGVTDLIGITENAKLTSQGFSGLCRTAVVFCGRIAALGSYAYDEFGWTKFLS